ncbi:MAG: DUF5305 domain-containing protein [Halobacteriales archaeon]|nr:DUF5305 domain-containing protein [Halobacteriales archaeon]
MLSNPLDAMQPLLRAARAHRAPLAAASALLLVLSAVWGMQAYGHVARAETTSVAQAWGEEGAFTYTVPVQRASPMFANGTVLGMGEPAYFSSISPSFDVTFVWKVAQPAATDAAALGNLVVQVRSETQDGRALWSLEFPLANGSSSAGEPLTMVGHADLPAMTAQVQDGMRALGLGEAKLHWTVLARVASTFHASWGEVRNSSAYTLPVAFDGPMYMLPTADEARSVRDHGLSVVSVRESRAGLAGLLGAPIPLAGLGLGMLGLGFAGAVGRKPRGGGPPPEAAEMERDLGKFGMWVTEVEGPMEPTGDWGPIVDLGSLGDLVDMAAEARTRVLLDHASRTFYVLTPQACYRFATHPWVHSAAESGTGGEPRNGQGGEPAESEAKEPKRGWPRN